MKQPAAQSPLLTLPTAKAVLRTAIPGMSAMILSSLCSLLDSLLLGRFDAAGAAAVSAGFPLLMLIQTIGFTFGMGAASLVSRSLGAGDRQTALRAASLGLYAALLLSLLVCLPGLFAAQPLARFLGAKEEGMAKAAAYARCMLASGPLLCVNLVISSLLRAQGKTLPNLAAFGVGAAVGSALQWLLISRMQLGVTGSGAAMIARESVTLLILLVAQKRCRCAVRPRLFLFSFRPAAYAPIMRYGLPTLVRQGMTCASSVLLSRVSGGFGQPALAGMGIATRLCALISSAVIGFGQGFQPVCGYAFGAGNMDRAREAYRFCMRAAVGSLILLGLPIFFLARQIALPFSASPEIAGIAAASLRVQSAVFFAQGAIILMNMLTQAMGLSVRASIVAASRQGYVLILLLLILPNLFGLPGLILCQGISDVFSLLLGLLVTRRVLAKPAPSDFSR